MASNTLASLVVRVGADIKGFTSDINRATTLSKRQSRAMVQSFKRVGAGVAAGLAVAINEAVKFEKAMAEVSTLLDDTSGIDNLTDSVRELSMEYGKAPVDQAKALYQIISAGASTAAEQMALMNASNKLAIGGVTDVAIAADGLTTVLNAYGMEASEAGHVSDLLFVGMKQGKTTIEEMSTSIGAVATIAAQTGVGLDELIAATATLTKSGIQTSEAMSGIKGVLSAVMKQSPQAVRMADELGVGFNIAAIESEGFASWLGKVQEATGGSAEKLAKLFGRVEGLTAVMSLGAEGGKEYNSILAETANAAGATDEAYAKMAETVGFQMGQLKATSQVLAETLGTNLLPIINQVASALLWLSTKTQTATEAHNSATLAAKSFGDALRDNEIASYSSLIAANKVAISGLQKQIGEAQAKFQSYNETFGEGSQQAEDLLEEIDGLYDGVKLLNRQIIIAEDAQDELNKTNKTATERSKKHKKAIKDMADGFKWLDQHIKETTRSQDYLNASYRNIIDTYRPLKAAQIAHKEELKRIEELHRSGTLVGEEYNEVIARSEESYRIAREAAAELEVGIEEVEVTAKRFTGNYPKVTKQVETASVGMVAVIENSFKTLDTTFQNFWSNLLKDGKFSLKGIKDLFLDTIAQMLHAALTQPIVLRIGTMMTGGLASGAANASGGLFGMSAGTTDMLGGALMAGAAGYTIGGMVFNENKNYGQEGAAVGAAAGAIIGSIIPVIGTMVGAVLGGLIGGALGSLIKKNAPKIKITGGGDLDMMFKNKDRAKFMDSDLGGFYIGGVGGGQQGLKDELIQGIRDFDSAMVELLGDNQLERVTDALKDWSVTLEGEGRTIENIIQSRFNVILGTFSEGVQEYVNQFYGLENQTEALVKYIRALNRIGGTIANFIESDPATQLAEQMEDAARTSTEKLAKLGSNLTNLFDIFDGSPEMMDEISVAIDARYRAELEYLAAINNLIENIGQSIEAQQRDIREAIQGPRSFEQIMNEAQGLRNSLATAQSPEEIANIVQQIQSLVRTAFGGLDESSKALQGDFLIAFLDSVRDIASGRATALGDAVIEEGGELREQATAFAEAIGAPLDLNTEAVDRTTTAIQQQTGVIEDNEKAAIERHNELVRVLQEAVDLEALRT